jgi:hypothetical protein
MTALAAIRFWKLLGDVNRTKGHLNLSQPPNSRVARIVHETASRDPGDGPASGQPQGLGSEAYLFSTSQGSRPEDARLPARQDGAAPGAGWSAAQSASGASTFLRPPQGLPGFPLEPRRKARPLSPLSMPRLCAFAEQTIPASRHPNRAYSSERKAAISAVTAGGSCIMRASPSSQNFSFPRTWGISAVCSARPFHDHTSCI